MTRTNETTWLWNEKSLLYSKGGEENHFSRTQVKSKSKCKAGRHWMLIYTHTYHATTHVISRVCHKHHVGVQLWEIWCSSIVIFHLYISLFMFRWKLRDYKQYCKTSFNGTLIVIQSNVLIFFFFFSVLIFSTAINNCTHDFSFISYIVGGYPHKDLLVPYWNVVKYEPPFLLPWSLVVIEPNGVDPECWHANVFLKLTLWNKRKLLLPFIYLSIEWLKLYYFKCRYKAQF